MGILVKREKGKKKKPTKLLEPCLKARALKICERASSLIFSVLVMFSILTHHCRTPSQPQPRQY